MVYKPSNLPRNGSPIIVLFHGGGWCFGCPEMDALNCIKAVQKYGAVALSVDYRLAPECPFPAAVNDSWDVLQWVSNEISVSVISFRALTFNSLGCHKRSSVGWESIAGLHHWRHVCGRQYISCTISPCERQRNVTADYRRLAQHSCSSQPRCCTRAVPAPVSQP